MRMGLIGFPDEQHLENLLSTRSRTLRWVKWPFVDADALWVNGAHAQMVRDGLVRVPSVDPGQRATVLNMREVDRPIAFTAPLHPNAMFKPRLVFDPLDAASVAAVMKSFEQQLHRHGLELSLAHQLAQRRYEMRSPVYHLILRGALVGVVALGGAIGLAPTLVGTDFDEIEWSGRPASAGAIAPDFLRTDMASVMWRYTTRTQQDLLPRRYKEGTIHFRRMPFVDQRLVRDIHLLVIAELRAMPQTWMQLRASTGMTDAQASQALAALYFAGSITTDARKAMAPLGRAAEGSASDMNTSIIGDDPASAPAVPARPGRRTFGDGPSTVPTPLEPPRGR